MRKRHLHFGTGLQIQCKSDFSSCEIYFQIEVTNLSACHIMLSISPEPIESIFSVKPRILKQLKNDDVQNGTSYKLNCTADGDPALQYSWNLNGRQYVPNGVLLNGSKTLHINPVTIDNEGIYACIVTNIEGNASTTANITVFGQFLYFTINIDETDSFYK